MLQRISLVLLFLLFATDGYLYYRFRTWLRARKGRLSIFCLPTALLLVGLIGLCATEDYSPRSLWLTGLYMVAYLVVIVPQTLLVLFLIFGQLGRRFSKAWNRCWSLLGGVVACISLGMILYGSFAGWRRFQVKEVTFASTALPEAFDGYRMVQLSDIHIGTIAAYPNVVKRLVQLVNEQRPDVILFTGDLVNHRAEELEGVEELLSQLKAPDGVYAVMGNHDYSQYLRWPSQEARDSNVEQLRQREARMGWHQLVNEHVVLNRKDASIVLAGVENDGNPPFPQLGDLPKALQGTERGSFKVLLSHDPTHWRRKVLPETDVQLTLSGHTHAMQFMIGDFTPSSWFYPENHGMYMEGERALYVNIGLGQVMLPFRFGAWPEITVITLRHK